ncbi:hypothetical protein [Chitinophaga silvatica]|uniref:hypothetical protein n=1 Tax=Chitinophaga silvatica TaxID=2282649 RepID=UPI0011C15FCC|nr:hypothetical protein [Chitinophaga silvatica]
MKCPLQMDWAYEYTIPHTESSARFRAGRKFLVSNLTDMLTINNLSETRWEYSNSALEGDQ